MKTNNLSNEDIIEYLEEARKSSNYCDTILALKKYNTLYKKSAFYKQTHMPLDRLYLQYSINATLTLKALLQNVNSFITNLDTTQLEQLLDEMNEKTQAEIERNKKEIAESDILNILLGLNSVHKS